MMERIHREQPKVEDVLFVPVAKQVGTEYRGFEGGAVEANNLPVDTMEGLQVSTKMPEGYFAKPSTQSEAVETVEE